MECNPVEKAIKTKTDRESERGGREGRDGEEGRGGISKGPNPQPDSVVRLHRMSYTIPDFIGPFK